MVSEIIALRPLLPPMNAWCLAVLTALLASAPVVEWLFDAGCKSFEYLVDGDDPTSGGKRVPRIEPDWGKVQLQQFGIPPSRDAGGLGVSSW
jgi:hypothetical protein